MGFIEIRAAAAAAAATAAVEVDSFVDVVLTSGLTNLAELTITSIEQIIFSKMYLVLFLFFSYSVLNRSYRKSHVFCSIFSFEYVLL